MSDITLYLVCMTHKKSGKYVYKAGITSKSVLERFDTESDKRYGDFDIDVLRIVNGPRSHIEFIEQLIMFKFPKNLVLEDHVGVDYGHYNKLSGITEIFIHDDISTVLNVIDLAIAADFGEYEANAFITKSNYLSMSKEFTDNTRLKYIKVNNFRFDLGILRDNISYRDSDTVYRWSPYCYNKAIIKDKK